MTSAHEPGLPATAAATGTARSRQDASSGRRSPQRDRSTVGMTSAGADADVLGMPVAWPAPARPADVVPLRRIRAPRCPVTPPTGQEVGWYSLGSPGPAAARLRHPTSLPAAASVLAGVGAAPESAHAARPTGNRARFSRPPSAGPSVSPLPQELIRALRSTLDVRADRDDVPAGRRGQGRGVTCPASEPTLPVRCDRIGVAQSGRRSRTQPPARLPVQARSDAARRRSRVDLRYHRPQHGASNLNAARFSVRPVTSRATGAASAPNESPPAPPGHRHRYAYQQVRFITNSRD